MDASSNPGGVWNRLKSITNGRIIKSGRRLNSTKVLRPTPASAHLWPTPKMSLAGAHSARRIQRALVDCHRKGDFTMKLEIDRLICFAKFERVIISDFVDSSTKAICQAMIYAYFLDDDSCLYMNSQMWRNTCVPIGFVKAAWWRLFTRENCYNINS